MVCRLQSLISFIFFYSLQGETVYYNAAQQRSLLGDKLSVDVFGNNQAKSQTHFNLFLRHSADLCMLATTQHVQIKILTLKPPNRCLPVIIGSVAE